MGFVGRLVLVLAALFARLRSIYALLVLTLSKVEKGRLLGTFLGARSIRRLAPKKDNNKRQGSS